MTDETDEQLGRLSRVLVLVGLVTYIASGWLFDFMPGEIVGWSVVVVGAFLHLARFWHQQGKAAEYWRDK